jgi:hypothetical protein
VLLELLEEVLVQQAEVLVQPSKSTSLTSTWSWISKVSDSRSIISWASADSLLFIGSPDVNSGVTLMSLRPAAGSRPDCALTPR